MNCQTLAYRVAFRYQEKEKKQHKVTRLTEFIRNATGLSRGIAEGIADAVVRGREVLRLALQKGWPLGEDGLLEGPKGTLTLQTIQAQV